MVLDKKNRSLKNKDRRFEWWEIVGQKL